MAGSIDQGKMQQAYLDLGVYPSDLAALRHLPYELAASGLDALKQRARRNFRRLSLDLHPDRTGNDPEKTERFKQLSAVRDELERVQVQARPEPRPVPMHAVAVNPFGYTQHATAPFSGARFPIPVIVILRRGR